MFSFSIFVIRCSTVGWLPWLPPGRRAATAASEVPDEDGVHRRPDEAARGAVRAHRLPDGGGAGRRGEEHRAERGDRQGESDRRFSQMFVIKAGERWSCVKPLQLAFYA